MFAIWIGIAVVAIILEASTMAMVSIWFALGAIAATLLCLCSAPIWAQVLVFVAVTLSVFLAFRKFWRDKLKNNFTPTNIDRNIGKAVLVSQEVNNLAGTGEIKVNGQLWSARSFSDDQNFPVGAKVVIGRIEGSYMYVGPAQ